MYPWLWIWAPHIHFPWSGSVAQDIEPRTDWFSEHIPSSAGDAQLEAQVTEKASYGTQLGLLTRAVLGLAELSQPRSPEAVKAIGRLAGLQASIDALKASSARDAHDAVLSAVRTLRARGGPQYQALRLALAHELAPAPETERPLGVPSLPPIEGGEDARLTGFTLQPPPAADA